MTIAGIQTYALKQGYRVGTISLLLVALLFAGCARQQDLLRVEERVQQIQNDQRILRASIRHIDSLITQSSVEDNQMRAEMRSAISDLNIELQQLQNRLDDLQQIVYTASQRGTGQSLTITPPPSKDTTAQQADTSGTEATSRVDCMQIWDTAFKDMFRGQYDLAISGFNDYLETCPEGELADNSQYWIAEAYYEMKQYERAIQEYDTLISKYPDTEKKVTSYYKLGRSYEELGDKKKALDYFLILQNEYPGSVEHEQVRDKIPALQKELGG
jgi:tol-pal system protein YbgF